MKRSLVRICHVGLWPLVTLAGPSAPTDRELHVASCVAALEANTDALVKQTKAGRGDLRSLLQDRMQAGVAFVGTAYLRGERDKTRAQELLTDAREAQKALPAAEFSARQEACAAEGAQLLASANFVERLVVWRLTGSRMNRLLAE